MISLYTTYVSRDRDDREGRKEGPALHFVLYFVRVERSMSFF